MANVMNIRKVTLYPPGQAAVELAPDKIIGVGVVPQLVVDEAMGEGAVRRWAGIPFVVEQEPSAIVHPGLASV